MYQALYRKYRPQTFDDVVGQKRITETLKAQLRADRLSHAYLFTGSRGTGKTSCAKILSKAVNCENPIDGNPCNKCAACNSIDSGSCMDVLEIDAASNNGVDHVRALRDDAIYTPSEVKKRVYIIDEVHMLSISAFNALLKIIEEPPPHLMFILATTELHKVPATILSRCQRFSFRRLQAEDIASRINYVAYQEGIEIDSDATKWLARLADGALRDGLSLLDQCASAVEGTVTVESVGKCLGLAGAQKTSQLMMAIAEHNVQQALEMFQSLYAEGKEPAALLNELCALSRDLLILKTAPQIGANMLSGICTDVEMQALLSCFTDGELLCITKQLQETTAGFQKSANRRIDAELCLISLCSPALTLDLPAVNARVTRLEEDMAAGTVFQKPVARKAKKSSPPAGEGRPPWDDEEPAFAADETEDVVEPAKKEAGEFSEQAPVGFWPDLVQKIHAALPLPSSGFFVTGPTAPVSGVLKGDMLLLLANDEFTKSMVDKPQVLDVVRQKASAMLQKQVGVRVLRKGEAVVEDDKMAQLIQFGALHHNIVKMKEN